MIKSYYQLLPRNYFGNLYEKVSKLLVKGENVCVSAMVGCGRRTFLNLFLELASQDKLFDNYYYFDPEIEKQNITSFVRKIAKEKGRKLVIIRLFELFNSKEEVLEKLQSLRQPNPLNLVFLILTDHTGVTKQSNYLAKSAPFFTERFYISPFDQEDTKTMIDVNSRYYAWAINRNLYPTLYQLSGGIPRLIKYVSKEITENKVPTDNLEAFILNPSINFELEQLTKIVLSTNKNYLKSLGLLHENGTFKSTLLEYYFKNYRVDLATDIFPNLTKLELKIFTILNENKDNIVSIDQIGDLLEMSGVEFSPWGIYKLISRLKVKIKKNFEIENLKGRGYVLRLSSKH